MIQETVSRWGDRGTPKGWGQRGRVESRAGVHITESGHLVTPRSNHKEEQENKTSKRTRPPDAKIRPRADNSQWNKHSGPDF